MSSQKKKFKVVSKVDSLINVEIGKRMVQNGEKTLKKELMKEIADYVGVGIDNVKMIQRGTVTPSLPVALKIAEYFNLKIEDIFEISDEE